MGLLGGLAGAGVALDAYQSQLERKQKIDMQRIKLQNESLQLQYLTQQAHVGAISDQLQIKQAMAEQAGQQAPPSPYDVTPPQGVQGAPQGAPQPAAYPGSQPMPQGGGALQGPIPQRMMPQGGAQQGAPNPLLGGQPSATGGGQPQQGQQQGGMASLPPPPTMQGMVQAIARQAQQNGANVQDPNVQRAIVQAAQKNLPGAIENYKLKLETVKAQQAAQDREQAMRDRQQDHQDMMGLRQSEMALAQSNRQQANASKGWELFQSKDGTLLRVNKDTGQVVPMDTKDVSKVGADTAKSGLSASTISTMADQYLAGDKSVVQNLGRGNQGRADLDALRNTIAEKMKAQGVSGKDQATKMAEFSGLTAGERSLGTRAAQMGMAVDEAQRIMPLALKASEAFPRTQFVPLNKAIAAVAAGTGDTNVARFVAANQSLINVYARAMSPTGVPTVSDKDHAREMLNTAQTKEQYKAVLDQMKQEMDAAQKAPGDVKVELGGGAPSGQSASGGKDYSHLWGGQ